MILLAHHGAEVPVVVVALITFAGPALLAFKCWLWDRRHGGHDDNTTDNG